MTFFCSPPSAQGNGSSAYVLVSPNHYGRSITVALQLAEVLRAKLRACGIAFTDRGNDDAEMEIGNTNWDKSVMRVKLHITMQMSPEQAKQALKDAGFFEGLPTCF